MSGALRTIARRLLADRTRRMPVPRTQITRPSWRGAPLS